MIAVLAYCVGLLAGFWLAAMFASGKIRDLETRVSWMQQKLDAATAGPSTYVRRHVPLMDPDERRRILLAQARLSADIAEIERVLTAEETREVDQWVGLQ